MFSNRTHSLPPVLDPQVQVPHHSQSFFSPRPFLPGHMPYQNFGPLQPHPLNRELPEYNQQPRNFSTRNLSLFPEYQSPLGY